MSTMKDVAVRAGVSIATVSRVFNDSGYVSEDLRQRVYEAAKDLHYRPSRVARSLRRKETRTIGVLVPQLDQPFFSSLTFAIQQRLVAEDYYTLVASTMEDQESEASYVNMLLEQRVDGVIIVPVGQGYENVERLLMSNIPVVLVDRDLPELAQINRILVDNEQGAYDGMSLLLEQGHRHIGIISGPTYSAAISSRLTGIRRALADYDLTLPDHMIVSGKLPQFEMGHTAARELLARQDHPSALFALTDVMALGAMHATRERLLRVPGDVSIMGFDDIPMATYSLPALTTIAQPTPDMGQRAAELLLNRLIDSSLDVESVTLPARLIERQSTGPYRKSS